MRIDLSDRTALVTGSTEGIGFAIAAGLAGAGAHVIVNGRDADRTEAAAARLRDSVSGAAVTGIAADAGTAAGCEQLADRAGAVDILVNNLGIYGPQDFFETDDATWQRFYDVNVMSGVRLSRALLPGMMARDWGRIIFLSSESAINIPADMIHYGMTKTANLAVSRGLAKRAAGTGVTVNAVLPGPTLSEGLAAMLEDDAADSGKPIEEVAAEFTRANRPSSIIGRAARVEEVANMVVYLASPQASATTGAAVRVDGGVVESAF